MPDELPTMVLATKRWTDDPSPIVRFEAIRLAATVERADHIDVWRVRHGERDIPEWMRQPEQ